MPTYAELQSEEVWRNQFVPPRLADLGRRLEMAYDPGTVNVGIYGDYRHLKGFHRSRAWILESRFCTNRTYSVVETRGNRSGGNPNWISALDLSLGYERSKKVWERINLAWQHGQIPYLRQVLLERSPWHVHLSFDRAHADDDHDTLFRAITGLPRRGGEHVNFDVELPVLRKDAEGEHVVTAQALLVARGHATKIDGEFGADTDAKTRAMQQHYGAEAVDGIWGPETWTIGIMSEDKR